MVWLRIPRKYLERWLLTMQDDDDSPEADRDIIIIDVW